MRNSNSSLYALMVYHRMQMVFVHPHHPTTIKMRNSNRLRSVPLVQWYQVTASLPLQPTAIPSHQRTFLLQSLAVTAMEEKAATIT
jgi:hypothetical protein